MLSTPVTPRVTAPCPGHAPRATLRRAAPCPAADDQNHRVDSQDTEHGSLCASCGLQYVKAMLENAHQSSASRRVTADAALANLATSRSACPTRGCRCPVCHRACAQQSATTRHADGAIAGALWRDRRPLKQAGLGATAPRSREWPRCMHARPAGAGRGAQPEQPGRQHAAAHRCDGQPPLCH